jgi:threonine dehydrogenase-like Zn-dependent dehydrogenase
MTSLFPATQRAVQIVGPDKVVLNPSLPVPELGPTQLLLEVEACGICFSDTKLMHAFDAHPRKSEVLSGIDLGELARIPGYHPGTEPVVPGHEPVARIVAIGEAVTRHEVGERVLVQTDYRHLPTAASNASFGYNLDGALEQYVIVDERIVVDPSGERFLIPVGEGPSASAVALIEPWACVEAAYAWGERQALRPGGRLLVVVADGREPSGLAGIVAQAAPSAVTVVGAADAVGVGAAFNTAGAVEWLSEHAFDDIVYFGSDAATIAKLGPLLAAGGLLNLVLAGHRIDGPVAVDVGRLHYDLIRYVGTTGAEASASYARIPARCELRPHETVAIIGAAGPMGLMHTVRTAISGVEGISMDAVDVDDARLAHLADVVAPVAADHGVPARFLNSRTQPVGAGYTYVAVMVPAPALITQAVEIAGEGAIVNAFAGFAVGTLAEVDLNAVAERGVYLVGTSGSRIEDMKAVLAKLESGALDTNVSLWAVTGLAGVPAAIESVRDRTSGGKIMVYPQLADMGLVKLDEVAQRLPSVWAAMVDGRWTRQAEEALLVTA